MFLRVSKEFHSSWSSIDVTLLVLWNLPVMYLAALRWTFSISLFCFLVCGDQMIEQYSRFYLTRDHLYAMLLVCSFFIWRFLLKNPNNFCAFDVMLSMCAFQVGRVELHAPLLLPRSFPQNITTLTTTIEGKPGAVPGFVVRGAWVGEGSGDRLRSPTGPGQKPVRGPRGAKPPISSGGLRNYRHLFERQFWTNHTIFIRPKKLYFES